MRISLEDFLQTIDESFKDKTQKDTYMVYFMLFSVIFSISYFFLWDIAKKDFLQTQQKILDIKSQLHSDKFYLQLNPKTKLIQLDKEIKSANAQMQIHKQNNRYIKEKIQTISSLIYDEVAWGNYLYSISQKAKEYNVKILNLTNRYNINKNSFGHILDIDIRSKSNYKDTLKFINSLEQSDLVVDIHDLNITAKDALYTDLNISVWGIAY